MKDYTLSEAKKICEEHRTCSDCPLKIITQRGIGCVFCNIPSQWQNPIEPRDMIELPCKISVRSDNESFWQVAYRGLTRSGIVIVTDFSEESEADAFLADLKDLLNGRKR